MLSSSTYFISSLIRYDGVFYHNDKKIKILDEELPGEIVETDIRHLNEAFVDGVREMCEDLYRQLVEAPNSFAIEH